MREQVESRVNKAQQAISEHPENSPMWTQLVSWLTLIVEHEVADNYPQSDAFLVHNEEARSFLVFIKIYLEMLDAGLEYQRLHLFDHLWRFNRKHRDVENAFVKAFPEGYEPPHLFTSTAIMKVSANA